MQAPETGMIQNRTFDEIAVGDSASLARTVTQRDIELFALASGDVNPAHMDPAYAATDMFHGIIAQGILEAGLISAVLEIWEAAGTVVVPEVAAATVAADKLATARVLAAAGVPVVPTIGVVPGAGVTITGADALATGPVKLFITATNVHTGQGRVFRKHEVTADVLLASACLPSMFQAIEIDGVPYWDGGYAGNPTMTPLVRECESLDTVLVQINPVERRETPRTAREIASRLNEISFNAQLLKELRMMALLRRVIDPGNGEARYWKEMRLHRITSDIMVDLGHSSKLNAEWDFLKMLFDEGRRAAEDFGRTHIEDIGVRSTFDIDALADEL